MNDGLALGQRRLTGFDFAAVQRHHARAAVALLAVDGYLDAHFAGYDGQFLADDGPRDGLPVDGDLIVVAGTLAETGVFGFAQGLVVRKGLVQPTTQLCAGLMFLWLDHKSRCGKGQGKKCEYREKRSARHFRVGRPWWLGRLRWEILDTMAQGTNTIEPYQLCDASEQSHLITVNLSESHAILLRGEK